jgi:hypothetical protein
MKKKRRRKKKRGEEKNRYLCDRVRIRTKYAKRELRHGKMARTDRKAGAGILNAVNGVNGLRRSKYEEGERKKFARVWQEAS